MYITRIDEAHGVAILDHTLTREVKVDLLVETINWVIFGLDYINPASTVECDYILRVIYDKYIMWEPEHR